ncbi:hypothetical protein [Nonomuraea aridisoli]|uniref:MarR family transcriptional regulator n=1 Tax=Nonomuraea aridisoli TaxID=2070368 RepID=A0A2W2E2U5_9ACTN|nr:hypothetical protein [Nonomuraea aridisoli]PZG16913.1 hypothetical protein C1J01_19655 [Nonomuraea aridisoli]
MSDGHPTAAQKEALRIICDHEPIPTDRLAGELLAARPGSTNPRYSLAITRMAGTLAWRLQAQGFVAEAEFDRWKTTPDGRALIACSSRDS